jgi:hypothetical protein
MLCQQRLLMCQQSSASTADVAAKCPSSVLLLPLLEADSTTAIAAILLLLLLQGTNSRKGKGGWGGKRGQGDHDMQDYLPDDGGFLEHDFDGDGGGDAAQMLMNMHQS